MELCSCSPEARLYEHVCACVTFALMRIQPAKRARLLPDSQNGLALAPHIHGSFGELSLPTHINTIPLQPFIAQQAWRPHCISSSSSSAHEDTATHKAVLCVTNVKLCSLASTFMQLFGAQLARSLALLDCARTVALH